MGSAESATESGDSPNCHFKGGYENTRGRTCVPGSSTPERNSSEIDEESLWTDTPKADQS